MNDAFETRLNTAATAGWWTLLVFAVIITIQYIAYLFVVSAHPQLVQAMWGGDMTWPEIQGIWFKVLVVQKLIFWVLAMVAIWVSVWSRLLRKAVNKVINVMK